MAMALQGRRSRFSVCRREAAEGEVGLRECGMALRKLVQKTAASAGQINPAVTLLRDVFREVPRILTIYDIDLADRDVRVSPQPLSRTPSPGSLLSPAGVPAAPPLRAHLVHARSFGVLAG